MKYCQWCVTTKQRSPGQPMAGCLSSHVGDVSQYERSVTWSMGAVYLVTLLKGLNYWKFKGYSCQIRITGLTRVRDSKTTPIHGTCRNLTFLERHGYSALMVCGKRRLGKQRTRTWSMPPNNINTTIYRAVLNSPATATSTYYSSKFQVGK